MIAPFPTSKGSSLISPNGEQAPVDLTDAKVRLYRLHEAVEKSSRTSHKIFAYRAAFESRVLNFPLAYVSVRFGVVARRKSLVVAYFLFWPAVCSHAGMRNVASARQKDFRAPAGERGSRATGSKLEPTTTPWIRPAVVVHEPEEPVDGLLAEFALILRGRGFNVAGYVQRNNLGASELGRGCAQNVALFDLSGGADDCAISEAAGNLRAAMREAADLVVISRFAAFEKAVANARTIVGEGGARGVPVLTSIAGRCIGRCEGWTQQSATLIRPDMKALWQWWGPERLYRDLAFGVAEDEVRRIVCGPRWIMVEGSSGAGLAYLPRSPREFLPRLPSLRRQSLRGLAALSQSWDPLEMALGVAAINAHYNRFDHEGRPGNGARSFAGTNGRTVVIGAFPGLGGILPNCAIIETEPKPGEFPPIAMDTLLPGCEAVVINSSALINRGLPRILRLAVDARTALIGPSTPLTSRLNHYGIEVLGGLVVEDASGLASAIQAGALSREFGKFGRYIHLSREEPMSVE